MVLFLLRDVRSRRILLLPIFERGAQFFSSHATEMLSNNVNSLCNGQLILLCGTFKEKWVLAP